MELSAHSDILVHWTGHDIEKQDISITRKNNLYLERFKNILKFGIWMKKAKEPESIQINDREIKIPKIARACFTELKLSMSEDHAKLYGKLGIGVKRYYLFDRLGAPINYCQFNTHNLFFPPYSYALTQDKSGEEILSFFKHMCSGRPLKYDLYNESEWQIIYSESIKMKLIDNGRFDRANLFVDPRSTNTEEIKEYYFSLEEDNRPEYLIPLDPWLAIVIYPNLQVKKSSIESDDIRELLKNVSSRQTVTGCPEKGCMPIELDLPACKNF
jgi:hypothetical protein